MPLQLPIRKIVPEDEAQRFAESEGGRFPCPQYCARPQTAISDTRGIVLVGDALHCFPPDLGQGVNSGLEDILVLRDNLERHDTMTEALEGYERERMPDVRALIRLMQVGVREFSDYSHTHIPLSLSLSLSLSPLLSPECPYNASFRGLTESRRCVPSLRPVSAAVQPKAMAGQAVDVSIRFSARALKGWDPAQALLHGLAVGGLVREHSRPHG